MGDGELLWNAVSEAVAPIAHLETQWDSDKLEKKIRDYFKKAAKGLQFVGKGWDVLINEYADAVFSSIFCGLGDRDWLHQADFLLCVDAGIKDLFPPRIFTGVPQQLFEQTVLQAADRAFDEQRYWTFRWETIQRSISGKGTQKKVREALDTARADAVQAEPPTIEDFVSTWLRRTVALLAQSSQGEPESCLPEETALELFQALIQEGGLPLKLVSEEGVPPRGWPAVRSMVQQCYAEYIGAQAGSDKGGKALGGKAKGKGYMGKALGAWSQGYGGEGAYQSWGELNATPDEPPAKRWKGGW